MQNAPGQYSANRKRQSKSWLQTAQRIIRLLILTRFPCSVFTDPKDSQLKHYYPKKKAVVLSIGSGQKQILMAERNQHLSFKYMEFVLTNSDVAVLTSETINRVFKPVFLKQFHCKTLMDILM